MDDMLRRTLELAGYTVEHVMNVTDVGHLTDDADEGEDKLEKGARKTGKTVWEVAQFYTDFFVSTMREMNISLPPAPYFCKATDHIPDMIDLIQKLEKNSYTYETDEAVYFSVEHFKAYGALSGQKLEEKLQAVRTEVNVDPGKRNQADFALWFKRKGRFSNHTMHWESPWGEGFPGWHIECSAMSMKYLGEQIDIHTGGIDHIPVHHENEIAQSEAATGSKPFVSFWIHHNFLQVEGKKMSKSLENFYTLKDVQSRSITPMALRMLFLQTHYRQESNFTWEAAEGAQKAFTRFVTAYHQLPAQADTLTAEAEQLRSQFQEALFDDLNTPKAVALLWEVLKSEITDPQKKALLTFMAGIFGLELPEPVAEQTPKEILDLVDRRNSARAVKDWKRADELREEIRQKGYEILDQGDTSIVKKG